ncbi:hypothetical protein KUL113_63820 [Tenacibaculum sp. KUL113]|nr:hypothetical protein KUL113_63820 [Tenacibaculum sp. KUL113]
MDIYINETNLHSFLNETDNELFSDCVKLLKRQLNVHFNFSKSKLKENDKFMSLARKLTEGVGNTETSFDNNFPSGSLKANTFNNFNDTQLSSVFWIDNEEVSKLKNTGSVIVAEPGEEISTIKGLFFNQDDYLFEKKYRIGDKGFEKWSDISNITLPLTDIVIADPYLFAKKDGDDTIKNTIDCLTNLSSKSFVRVNAVVFINPAYTTYTDDEIKIAIRKGLKDSTGIKPNVTIIKTRKGHDRTILTNYKRVYSGDTFNYWNDKGVLLSKGVEIAFSSLANSDNHTLFNSLITDLQSVINFNKQNKTEYNLGDKVSNYLTF